jgi:single-strand DNA-binding protein
MEINNVVLGGRLTKVPEGKHTTSGTFILNGSLAVNRRVKQGDQWVDKASFFDWDYIGKGAEAVAKFLDKGKEITIIGELVQEQWTDKDGGKRSKVKVFVTRLKMHGGAGEKQAEIQQSETFEDDVPF